MNRRWVALAMFVLSGCSDGKDNGGGGGGGGGSGGGNGGGETLRAACMRVTQAACAVLVRCHALAGSTPFTESLCAQALPDLVDACATEGNDVLAAASDAAIDDCVTAYEDFSCSNLCNQVAQDPPACLALGAEPSDTFVSCQ